MVGAAISEPPMPYRCVRYALVLPEAIRYGTNEWIVAPTEPHPDTDHWVMLRFTQVNTPALAEAAARTLLGHASGQGPSELDPSLMEHLTVVDAITPDLAFGPEPLGFRDLRPQDRTVPQDPLNRCIDSVDRICRAYRIAANVPIGRVTYERIFPFVAIWRSGDGSSLEDVLGLTPDAWRESELMRLAHHNVARPVGPSIDDDLSFRMMDVAAAQVRGDPSFVWRDRMLEAWRSFEVEGSFSSAVVLAHTATEVFLDGLLLLMLWEEREDPEDVAPHLGSGTAVARMTRMFHDRLGGRWTIQGGGEVAQWYEKGANVRHRTVHLGREPTRSETREALESSDALRGFALGRLIERRNRYKRTTMMTVGIDELQRRDLWKGAIRRFFEGPAQEETNWNESYAAWRARVSEQIESMRIQI